MSKQVSKVAAPAAAMLSFRPNAVSGEICYLVQPLMSLAGNADFTLVNKTGYDSREVFLSPTHKTKWGPDRLGDDTLDNNESRKIKFGDKASCVQDLKVVFDDDGSDVTWEEFDLCKLNKITLKYNRKSRTVSADTE